MPFLRTYGIKFLPTKLLLREDKFLSIGYIISTYMCPLLILALGIVTRRAYGTHFRLENEQVLLAKAVKKKEKERKQRLLRHRGSQSDSSEIIIKMITEENQVKTKIIIKKNIFTMIYLIFYGIFYGLICSLFSKQMNAFKVLMIIVFSYGLLRTTLRLIDTIEKIRVYKIIELLINYFSKRYVKAKKNTQVQNMIKERKEGPEKFLEDECYLLKTYYNQSMAYLEEAILKNWKLLWMVCFFPSLLYNAVLMVLSYLFFKVIEQDSGVQKWFLESGLLSIITGINDLETDKSMNEELYSI